MSNLSAAVQASRSSSRRGEPIRQHDRQASFLQLRGDVVIRRAVAAAAATVRENHHAPRTLVHHQVRRQDDTRHGNLQALLNDAHVPTSKPMKD
jgi:hypothetical protein